MITVSFMKPFYTKVAGKKLRLVFAYQYFSIMKDDEVFHFIPIEGKEMVVNLETREVENLSTVFVFQRGNKFIRMPLYQLLLVSNINEHLTPLVDEAGGVTRELVEQGFSSEVRDLLLSIREFNINSLIDTALDEKDEQRFYELVNLKKRGSLI